jgi:ectoine hydroxylase-related dioxygenase (phytanoyl-CoA dioxygenase family)
LAQHQDYGYWYSRYLRPELLSCYIAIDRATAGNGALTCLRGSHKAGRIEHTDVRGQPGGRPKRVDLLRAALPPPVVCEMEAGDCLFFHCNTLHTSAPNRSADPRWALIACFCSVTNPVVASERDGGGEGPARSALPREAVQCVEEAAIMEVGARQLRSWAASPPALPRL